MMKNILILCLLFSSISSFGQQAKSKQNELGLFIEANGLSSDQGFGVQFKKAKKNNKAYRVQALYRKKSILNDPFEYTIVKDTIKTKAIGMEYNSFYVGLGIEQQRQFYKKCYLYASLDARIGFGKADIYQISNNKVIDTLNQVYFSNAFRNYSTKEQTTGIESSWFGVDILPSIGSKVILQHLVFGIETGLNLSNNYRIQRGSNVQNYSIYDLDLSYLNYRVYVNYLF